MLALGVAAYAIERSGAGPGAGAGRSPVELFAGIVGIVLGALLFAGALADGGEESWIGLGARPAVRGARVARGGRARRTGAAAPRGRRRGAADRLCRRGGPVLAAIAIFVPPLSFLALIGFVLLLLGGRRREGEKYAGLRILR